MHASPFCAPALLAAVRPVRSPLEAAFPARIGRPAQPLLASGGMADFQNLDVLEELQARLTAELEPLVRCARLLRDAARRLPRLLRQRCDILTRSTALTLQQVRDGPRQVSRGAAIPGA